MIALMTIATGEKYRRYAEQLFISAEKHFPAVRHFLFTDAPKEGDFKIGAKGYPMETLMRYHTFLSQKEELLKYEHIFFADADMRFVANVKEEEVAADGLVATLHPGFAVQNTQGSPERRQESTSYLPTDVKNKYYCGGFQGGKTKNYLKAAEDMAFCIDMDLKRGIIPVWHDESMWNCYLYFHPPAKTLTPSFCTPEESLAQGGYCGWKTEQFPPVLLAVDKKGQR